MIEGFLLGVIVTASLTAAGFFWRFYRQTRDKLFFAFAAAFAIEGINRMAFLLVDKPSEGSPIIYLVRLVAFLLILGAIVAKNRDTPPRKK
jgi:uncharacterized membrane protein HdeD (DUF308 family)